MKDGKEDKIRNHRIDCRIKFACERQTKSA